MILIDEYCFKWQTIESRENVMETNKLNFLQNKLENEKLQNINIYYKGNKIYDMSNITCHKSSNKTIIFKIEGGKMRYVISKKEIEDALVIPFDDTIIILILNNDINVEMKFHKEV